MKGITKRWVTNALGITLGIVVTVVIIAVLVLRSSYYAAVERTLLVKSESLRTYVDTVSDYYGSFSSVARVVAEDFEDGDMAALEIMDATGNIIVSSQGFTSPLEGGDDYIAALADESGTGIWYGRFEETGERVVAVTSLVYDEYGRTVGGIRLISSLSRVDLTIFAAGAAFCLLGLVVMVVAVISGTYFINTIVIPVNEITGTARKIASGDYKIRINKKYDDEIGDLCDTINDLAEGLTEANKVKNDFISTVSHELRTPLTAIKGWGETLMTAGDDKVIAEKGLKVIVSETERLSKMVEELLDFSRLQSGRLTMKMDSCDVLAELEEAVLAYTPRAEKEGKTLKLIPPKGEVPVIFADSDRIRQVFINIIDNSIKYTDKGGEVTVSLTQENGHVTVTVEDNGCGIAEADMTRIGEKFYKANFTRHGAGIGLATCEEIVRQHNGVMGIESVEGKGTKVTVALPVSPQQTGDGGQPSGGR